MLVFRPATEKDIKGIAALHTKSWRQNYRGALSDKFLDHEAQAERLNVWESRLKKSSPNQHVIVAEYVNEIVGFVCLFFNQSKEYGTLLDNLHVSATMQRKGIGYRLMNLAAKEIQHYLSDSNMYLWVLEQNLKAIEFYEALGGEKVETVEEMDIGDRPVIKSRYYWKSLEKLIVEKEKS